MNKITKLNVETTLELVCVYVDVCVCMYVCVYEHKYGSESGDHPRAGVYVCMNICMYA